MGTAYTEVYDLFLMISKDYELDELYASSPTNFSTYLEGFLIYAIADFTSCKQNLELRNALTQTFDITLTTKELVILSKLVVIAWLKSKIQNVTQFQLNLNDRDFRLHSEAQNLTAKANLLALLREEVSQDMVDYGYSGLDITTWGGV